MNRNYSNYRVEQWRRYGRQAKGKHTPERGFKLLQPTTGCNQGWITNCLKSSCSLFEWYFLIFCTFPCEFSQQMNNTDKNAQGVEGRVRLFGKQDDRYHSHVSIRNTKLRPAVI